MFTLKKNKAFVLHWGTSAKVLNSFFFCYFGGIEYNINLQISLSKPYLKDLSCFADHHFELQTEKKTTRTHII